CESCVPLPDLTDPNSIWASWYGDEVTRYDARLKKAHSVSPWRHTLDSPPNESKYRCHWTPPLAIDPFDHNTVYYGCQVIFQTSNGGQSWAVISPDLSTQDPSRIISSGGITGDNLGQFYGEVVFAIAPSPIRRGLIWAGTNDGQIWYTKDGSGAWVNVTKNVTGMPPWGTVRTIEPSRFDSATAYVAEGLPAAPVTWIEMAKPYHDVIVSTYGRGLWVLRDVTALEQRDSVARGGTYLFPPAAGYRQARGGSALFTVSLDSSAASAKD